MHHKKKPSELILQTKNDMRIKIHTTKNETNQNEKRQKNNNFCFEPKKITHHKNKIHVALVMRRTFIVLFCYSCRFPILLYFMPLAFASTYKLVLMRLATSSLHRMVD